MTKDRIKNGDVVALVTTKLDCDTPLFIGIASRCDEDENEYTGSSAAFAGTWFFDAPECGFVAKKIPYDLYIKNYNFFYPSGKKGEKLQNTAKSKGYVWCWFLTPVRRVKLEQYG
jgi:hypothetical protein